MLEGRSIYIWNLNKVMTGSSDDLLDQAQAHHLSSLWIKIADGSTPFHNVTPPWDVKLKDLVTKAHARHMTIFGYHVPHCANQAEATAESSVVAELARTFSLDGLVVDNEEGAAYFRGGPNEARTYAQNLRTVFDRENRALVMSSHDIPSAHPQAQAAVIAQSIHVNAPQVYYGQSSSVAARLNHAIADNAAFHVPFIPVGALFLRKPGDSDGGCSDPNDCAHRAADFIGLVSQKHAAFPDKYPGYGFWNWEEAPAVAWSLLQNTPVFV